jgi:MFS family permease
LCQNHVVRRLWVLYLVVFVGFVGYALMITVFTPLLLNDQGSLLPVGSSRSTRTVLLGLLLSLYPLGQFLGAPVLGALSDRWGRRPVLLLTLTVGVLGYVSISLALASAHLVLLMVFSFITGLFEANVAIAQSAIADVAVGGRRGTLFGYVYLASSLAYVVGPLVGGPLADPQVVSWARDWLPFAVVAAVLLVALVGVATLLPETRVQPHRDDVGPTGAGRPWWRNALAANVFGLVQIARDHRLRRFFLVNGLFYLAIFGFFRTYPLYLVDHFGLSLGQESVFIAWVAVPIVIANLWLVPLLFRRSTPRRVLAGAGFLTGVSLIVVPLPGVLWTLWITLALASFGIALLLAFCAAQVSSAAGEDEQGRVLGNNQSLQVGAEVVSGLAGGALAAVASGTPLVVFGVVTIVAAVVSSSSRRRLRTPDSPAVGE